jgi:uncharacterized membrane protein (UPF0127 family)
MTLEFPKLIICVSLAFIPISNLILSLNDVVGQVGQDLELPNKVNITVNNFNLTAEIAVTPEEQSKGLSIKEDLQENQGMIFPYKAPKVLAFWMKDMKFPIDIFWLDSDKRVVHIEKNLQPCNPFLPCPSFSPDTKAQYVLETVAGLSDRIDIKIGTQVDFQLPTLGSDSEDHF